MVCLDTNFLIGIQRGDEEAVKKIKEFEALGVPVSTTPITAAELFKGAHRSEKPGDVDIVRELLQNMELLEFDLNASEHAGKIFEELRKQGTPIGDMDTIIGAICLTHGEPLVTRDMHFDKIKGLIVQHW